MEHRHSFPLMDAQPLAGSAPDPVVVVGGGPVGVRMAQALSRRGAHVVLLNAERWQPYNRVQLTPLLAGEAQIGQVWLDERFPGPGRVDRYDGVSVVDIDREARRVFASTGRIMRYSALVLAVGSRAFVPGIPGAGLDGVHVFRNFNDAEALVARSMAARRVVVIGGGLLGLEAARGMARRGAQLSVVEHENRPMPRQLDEAAGALLKARIETLGIEVLTGTRVLSINGESRVESVSLSGERDIKADTVIVCTGIRANTQLAGAVGLDHARGILVDDSLRTSDPHIFAVGECAEHRGTVYGLVGPGFEQVQAAAAVIMGEDAAYRGSTPATKLKVLGSDVFSMGDFESVEQQATVQSHLWTDEEAGLYRRLFTHRGRLVAALGVGGWPEAARLQQAVVKGERIGLWSLRRFRRDGRLWPEDTGGARTWPAEAIVCNCTGTTKGTIAAAIAAGAPTIEDVRAATGANTVCGTCKPLVLDLLGQGDAAPEPVRWWKPLLWMSAIAALIGLASLLLPRVPMAESFRVGDVWYKLWFDSIWKQWTGFSLLGLTFAAALIGLRKRIGIARRLGGYDWWRIIHLGIGGAAAIGLAVHTGFRLGSNLNAILMASFLATLVFGAIAGLSTGAEHKLQEQGVKRPRTVPVWAHVLALWPLPVLLAAHVLSVYTY